ncbi:hypothetical protein HPP92_006397 [Vanilla planifolia]|uniref:DUF1639 family protein n=1 Tax=Vanilla planifolia TaxID=51239 RepID=A0A835V9Z3_VANPL|nr:hypothetical protein HPP92_006397 [Vanilla planifolia]
MAPTAAKRGKSQSHLHRDISLLVQKPWAGHRLLHCDSGEENGKVVAEKRRSTSPNQERDQLRPVPRIGDPGISAVGEDDVVLEELRLKLMGHLREVADRMNLDVRPADPTIVAVDVAAPDPAPLNGASEAAIPWTLRTRRASQRLAATERVLPTRSADVEKKAPQKFSVSLSKEEIDEDVFALTGSRPRRRPKKRPRIVQRQLDAIFPGLWLSEITPESYRVQE